MELQSNVVICHKTGHLESAEQKVAPGTYLNWADFLPRLVDQLTPSAPFFP
jgi:hypothetical protein